MRDRTLSLSCSLALAAAIFVFAPGSWAAEKPQSSKSGAAHKVWTNEDLDDLRAQGLITTFNQVAEPVSGVSSADLQPSQTSLVPATETIQPRSPRTQDPEWYVDQAAFLQLELNIDEDALRQQLAQLDAVKSLRNMEPGIALDKGNIGITPESAIDMLEARIRDVQEQLDELADLARINGIPPGALRGRPQFRG